MNHLKEKQLFSSSRDGVCIQTRCQLNTNTGHVGIYTRFMKGKRLHNGKKYLKTLYSSNYNGVRTRCILMINTNTNHITIFNSFTKQSDWNGGAAANPMCGAYLGIHIAERILSRIFKDVEVMPNGNPGYDFICNHGKKIDVKSACSIKGYHSWGFAIRCNIVADYFLCLAFDNRKDLNPLHIWLIPGCIINDHTGVRISESTRDKWDQYELTDKLCTVTKCCDYMKGT